MKLCSFSHTQRRILVQARLVSGFIFMSLLLSDATEFKFISLFLWENWAEATNSDKQDATLVKSDNPLFSKDSLAEYNILVITFSLHRLA